MSVDLFPRPAARVVNRSLRLPPSACMTDAEKLYAQVTCEATPVPIDGLGQTRPEDFFGTTRWRNFDPCGLERLSQCPTYCLSETTAQLVGHCLAGTTPDGWRPEDHDNWCAAVAGGILNNRICPDVAPDPPPCITEQQREDILNGYCLQNMGYRGPDPAKNALCWGAVQSGYLGAMLDAPTCPPQVQPQPAPAPVPGPAPGPAPDLLDPLGPFANGGGGAPPVQEPPLSPTTHEPRTERSSMMVPGLLFLAVVAAGGAYYMSQRKGRR